MVRMRLISSIDRLLGSEVEVKQNTAVVLQQQLYYSCKPTALLLCTPHPVVFNNN